MVENARIFLNILSTQAEVKDQLYVADPEDTNALLSFALQKGYAFSEPDLVTALSELQDPPLVEQLNTILKR